MLVGTIYIQLSDIDDIVDADEEANSNFSRNLLSA